MLVRFAGTRLAAGDDDLIPTALRRGGRTLGGALSWETPKHIAPFEAPSPFVGLAAPDEVTVTRQVLAEPEPGLADKTWARLADGTPLVTAERRGKGLIVLFHVTADTTWSNLPISGLFVDMLRAHRRASRRGACGARGERSKANTAEALPPLAHARRLRRARRAARRRRADPGDLRPATPTPSIRPASTARREALIAVNALALGADAGARPITRGCRVRAGGLDDGAADRPQALAAAARRSSASSSTPLASLWSRAAARFRAALRSAAPLALAAARSAGARRPGPRGANQRPGGGAADPSRLCADRRRRGRRDVAARPRQARRGARRSGLRADIAEPVGLDPARDELAFYPLIYWPIVAGRPQPPSIAVAHIAAYHEERRHGRLRHARRARRSRRAARGDRRKRCGCASCSPASTCPSSSRCRATTW